MRITYAARRALAAAVVTGAAGLAACADTGVTAPQPGPPAFGKSGSTSGSSGTSSGASYLVSQTVVRDTTVTKFVVSTDPSKPASFGIGNSSKIDFPYAAQSVCDPRTSSYGSTEWDKACTASAIPVEITAKTWLDARGYVQSDFQPALRFVPKATKPVTLYLKNPALASGGRIDYCTSFAGCVDEAATDPSVATYQDRANGFLYRRIKHFSGYAIAW